MALNVSMTLSLKILIYRSSQAKKQCSQGMSWYSFLKNSPETLRSQTYFLARSLSKRVSQKARKSYELSYFWGSEVNGLPFWVFIVFVC